MSSVEFTGRQYGGSSMIIPPNILTIQKANNLFVNEEGDKIKGKIDMSNNKIINIAEPTNSYDVANKLYVDNTMNQIIDTKGIIKPEKLPQIDETFKEHTYILDIGESNIASHKLSKFQIKIDEHFLPKTSDIIFTPKGTKLTKEMIHIQITPFLDTDYYHDELFIVVQRFVITNNDLLDIYIVTNRSNKEPWGLKLKAFLTLKINIKNIKILKSI
jgi:hypothetical protein